MNSTTTIHASRVPRAPARAGAPLALVAVLAAVAFAGSCEGCAVPEPTPPPVAQDPFACDAGDIAFVQQATLAILGRRPLSLAEVDVAAQAIAVVGREAWARSIMSGTEFVDRWEQHTLDSLFVPRTGVQSLAACYGAQDRVGGDDDPALAEFVRDTGALDDVDPDGPFTYRDLLRSSLALDDLSPIYRGHLFALVTTPNPCGNVDPVKQELAIRDEVGAVFDAAYLDRDPVCLACHNSETSVTDRDDPALDRHWPLAGSLEAAVFGSSSDVDPKVAHAPFRTTDFFAGAGGGFGEIDLNVAFCFDVFEPGACVDGAPAPCGDGLLPECFNPFDPPICGAGPSPLCANTPLCYDGFNNIEANLGCSGPSGDIGCPGGHFPICVDGSEGFCDAFGAPACAAGGGGEGEGEGGFTPWGADGVCGVFVPDVPDDPADVDARLASATGKRATVIHLEAALRRGVDSLAARGLVVRGDGSVDGPDEALAYLIAAHVVDGVRREVAGSALTIATHFPRNAASREELDRLTTRFVASHFSLKTALTDVVMSPYFNQLPPDAGCGDAYALPAVFDPWVLSEPDEAMRNNSAADALHVLSGRTLLRAAYAALGWPHPESESFPEAGGEFDDTCFAFSTCDDLVAECNDNAHCCFEVEAFGCSATLTELELQRGLGVFHGFSEKGFRGVDFQVRLTWEARFGRCEKPAGVGADFIDELGQRAVAGGNTVGDAVSALKERLIGEPAIDPDEAEALAELDGPLTRGAAGVDIDGNLRAICGVLLSTPQFQLAGLPPEPQEDASSRGALSPSLDDACASLVARGIEGYSLSCEDGRLSVEESERRRVTVRVLFVCLGNICRSPTAHGVMKRRVADAKLAVDVDSCGTAGYHVGEPPDPRTIAHARKRGYDLSTQRARTLAATDFERFDRIYAMDRQNLARLRQLSPPEHRTKISLFLDVLADGAEHEREVPDPWAGGADEFERVLDLVERACDALVAELVELNALAARALREP